MGLGQTLPVVQCCEAQQGFEADSVKRWDGGAGMIILGEDPDIC
jgi:hypothetical protein